MGVVGTFAVEVKLKVQRPTTPEQRQAFNEEVVARAPFASVHWSGDGSVATLVLHREGHDSDSVCHGTRALVKGWAQDNAQIGPDAELAIDCHAAPVE